MAVSQIYLPKCFLRQDAICLCEKLSPMNLRFCLRCYVENSHFGHICGSTCVSKLEGWLSRLHGRLDRSLVSLEIWRKGITSEPSGSCLQALIGIDMSNPRNENPRNYDSSHVDHVFSRCLWKSHFKEKKLAANIVVFQNLGCSASGFSLRIMLLSRDLQGGIQPRPAAFGKLPVLWQCICPRVRWLKCWKPF